jgi:hypothetical protein
MLIRSACTRHTRLLLGCSQLICDRITSCRPVCIRPTTCGPTSFGPTSCGPTDNRQSKIEQPASDLHSVRNRPTSNQAIGVAPSIRFHHAEHFTKCDRRVGIVTKAPPLAVISRTTALSRPDASSQTTTVSSTHSVVRSTAVLRPAGILRPTTASTHLRTRTPYSISTLRRILKWCDAPYAAHLRHQTDGRDVRQRLPFDPIRLCIRRMCDGLDPSGPLAPSESRCARERCRKAPEARARDERGAARESNGSSRWTPESPVTLFNGRAPTTCVFQICDRDRTERHRRLSASEPERLPAPEP